MTSDTLFHIRRFALAAIDLDGTLLGPDLTISAANLRAVARLQRHGTEVVLASGRHFTSILPYTRQLPAVRWIISSQGGEVATSDRRAVLRQMFLTPDEARAAIVTGQMLGFSTMGYAAEGIYSDTPNREDRAFYARLTGCIPAVCEHDALLDRPLHKVVWIGDPGRIDTLAGTPTVTHLALQTVRTHERLFEVLPNDATKGSGLDLLARHLGVHATDAVVFGDADNDLPMFAWAGTSVAMPHGQPRAHALATHIGPDGNAAEALARAIDQVLAPNAKHH